MVIFGGLWGHTTSYGDSSSNNSVQTGNNSAQSSATSITSGGATSTYGSILVSSSKNASQQQPRIIDPEAPSLTLGDFSETTLDVFYLCTVYLSTYIFIAVMAFSFVFEKWSIIDSVYFAVSTFTTVGYGDLQPTTPSGQIFTVFFAVYGVIILGIFIGIFGRTISEGQAKAVKKLKRKKQKKILNILFNDQDSEKKKKKEIKLMKENWFDDHKAMLKDVTTVVKQEAPEILAVMFFAYILGVREGWSLTSTAYFCVMSASTTGFGDYTPATQLDKLYCVFFLPLAVAVFGEVLGRIANLYINRKTRDAEQQYLRRTITQCDLRNMDANHDGTVDMEEFLCFMLVALQKVDQESIDDLRDIFNNLDSNGNGVLDKEDLVERTQSSAWSEMQKIGQEEEHLD